MIDIVDRLRRWTHAVDAAPASDLMDEAAAEIERLRAVTEPMPQEKRAEVPTLTDAEREAVAAAISDDEAATAYASAATLRGLLARLAP